MAESEVMVNAVKGKLAGNKMSLIYIEKSAMKEPVVRRVADCFRWLEPSVEKLMNRCSKCVDESLTDECLPTIAVSDVGRQSGFSMQDMAYSPDSNVLYVLYVGNLKLIRHLSLTGSQIRSRVLSNPDCPSL